MYSAIDRGRLEHQVGREEGAGEEEDHEDQREQALDDRGLAGAERDRGAEPAEGDRRERRRARSSAAPRARPRSIEAPKIRPIAMNQSAVAAPSAAVPASRPRTIAKREIGAASSRSVKPISMSTASAMPPLLPASRHDWIIAPASMKSRKPSTSGKPGRSTARAGAAGLDREQQGREDEDRRDELRAAEGLLDRARAERADHAQVGASRELTRRLEPRPARPRRPVRSSSPSRCSPVLATKTSSSVGSTRSSDSTRIPASSSARTTLATSLAPRSSSTSSRAVLRGQDAAEVAADLLGALGRAVGEPDLEVRLADLGLERGRRALGDDPPVVDDPDPVGELVGLLEVLGGEEDGRALAVQRRDLLPDRLAADRVEAGRRLVEEEHPRLVDERRGEVEPPAHPARVGADAAVGGLRRGRRARAARRRAARPRAPTGRAASPAARISSRPVISGSSAASWRATPIARRTSAASSTTSWPATRGAAAGRAQQRGQHPHRGRLAGAVRAEEGVDLALGDLEVDAVDGPDPARELALEPCYLDCRHGGGIYRRARERPKLRIAGGTETRVRQQRV